MALRRTLGFRKQQLGRGIFYSVHGFCGFIGIKSLIRQLHIVWMPNASPQSDSFEELAMPLFDQLYNFAHWLTKNGDDAEDLVQETYVKALKGFSSFRLGTNFRAWIYRILRNTFLTSRTGLKEATLPIDPDESESIAPVDRETPESIFIDRSDQCLLEHAIEQLPVHHREILLLSDVEEMSYQEISETLCIPMGTVMSRLSRARKALRSNLGMELQKRVNHGL
jgi:RNA polymerase sigma-70 factor, ECF subfamily